MENELLPHLFRTEYRKIISVLCRHFGLENITVAEDLASDTFLAAAEIWGRNGLPANPVAWLYHVAKNKARDQQKHARVVQRAAAIRQPESEEVPEIDLSEQNIRDSQLQMLFALCQPIISPDAQTGLALRILCGFGIDEIAEAFLSNKETINKRLFRAKETLRKQAVVIEFPTATELPGRLQSVLRTLYLLFNEGYYSTSQNTTVRKELCLEAMRLNVLLTENETTNVPDVNALLALMCFHASRLDARTDETGEIIPYDEQDSHLWNEELIKKGTAYLRLSSSGTRISKYHLEATMAWWHTHQQDTPEKWENILQLYNELLLLEYSPVAALNRTYALAKACGKNHAIAEAMKLPLTGNHFYHVLLGYLYTDLDNATAKSHLETALQLARTDSEKSRIQKNLDALA